MAGQISTIKKRLQNVVSTKKLTNATELVATVKLQKYNTKTKQNEEYAKNLKHFIMAVLQSESSDVENNPFLKKPYAENPLYIVITSNSGLCGSYNTEVLKYVSQPLRFVTFSINGVVTYRYGLKQFLPKLIQLSVQLCEVILVTAIRIAEFPLRDPFPHAWGWGGSEVGCQAKLRVVDAFECNVSIEHGAAPGA